eukprot:SAG31_NODE_817_length_11849_cov_6.737362_5_plen_133_part_00
MDQLRLGGISIGDRSKVRLLLGDGCSQRSITSDGSHGRSGATNQAHFVANRRLQQEGDGGISGDTIAIVASVLVGAAGFLVQAHTERRAQQSATIQVQELHQHEQTRQREHEQMLSQIARTDRWLDDCARMQ